MALQPLEAGEIYFPAILNGQGFEAGTSAIDATGERSGVVILVPKTGTVDKFAAFISAVGNAPDNGLRFSFQNVDLANGNPDGSVDQFATVASGSVTTGWLDPGAFDTNRSVTRGDLLALVCDFPTFVAGDSVTLGMQLVGDTVHGLPYGFHTTASKDTSQIARVALHYTDSTWAFLPFIYPASATPASLSFDSGSATADEWGSALMVPFPCTMSGIRFCAQVGPGCDYEVVLYDNADSALATKAVDGHVSSSSGVALTYTVYFDADVTLSANTLYRMTLRPTTTTSDIAISYVTVPNGDILRYCWEGGDNLYMTSRLNQAGAWTNYNNGTDGYRRWSISAILRAFDDGTAGGGAGEVAHTHVG